MKRATIISISALIVTLLSGCAARSLSVLQAEFNTAVENRALCGSNETFEPEQKPTCSVDYQTIFADIATQSERSLMDYKGSPSVKIGLHRLHAYALWQSGAAEKTVVQAARKGLAECAGDNYAKAPRDCALLVTIGSLKGVEAAGAGIEAIGETFAVAADKQAVCNQNAVQWREVASDFWQTYYLPLAVDMETFAARQETPKSVLKYLQKQHQLVFDQLDKLKTIGRRCVPDNTVARQLIACPCNPNLRTDADQAACDTVFDTTHPGYAFYYETFCMSEDVFKSRQCPCGEIDSQNLSPQQTKACDHVNAHPDSMTLYKAACRVEKALTAN